MTALSARVDSWLWAVGVFKTRSAATAATRSGHIHVNGDRAKAAQHVKAGDEVRVRIAGFDRILMVREIISKRVGAVVAVEAYTDNSLPCQRPKRWPCSSAATGVQVNPLSAGVAIWKSYGAGYLTSSTGLPAIRVIVG